MDHARNLYQTMMFNPKMRAKIIKNGKITASAVLLLLLLGLVKEMQYKVNSYTDNTGLYVYQPPPRDAKTKNFGLDHFLPKFDNEPVINVVENLSTSLLYGIDITDLEKRSYTNDRPFTYLDEYENPCWLEKLTRTFETDYRSNQFYKLANKVNYQSLATVFTKRLQEDERPWRMRCLPYFYLLGVTKSGTTDLFDSLTRHPQVHGPWVKEPMYWNRRRYPGGTVVHKNKRIQHMKFSGYVDMFDHGAHEINMSRAGLQHIIGDGSSYTFWEDNGWQGHPGNKGLTEPKYTTAMALSAAQPHAKLIVLLRNPTDRVYSAYTMYSGRSKSPTEFHKLVLNSINQYNTCLSTRTVRSCIYDVEMSQSLFPISFRSSFYAAHLKEWLDVYPREQLYIIKSEDYYQDRMLVMEDVFQYLKLQSVGKSQADTIEHKQPSFKRSYKGMLNSTREVLDKFFEPFNKELEDILGRKLWSETT